MNAQPAKFPSASRLPTLPAELLHLVLCNLLTNWHTYCQLYWRIVNSTLPTDEYTLHSVERFEVSVLRANKLLHSEGTGILYGRNVFCFAVLPSHG
jgi:hypothetical protein